MSGSNNTTNVSGAPKKSSSLAKTNDIEKQDSLTDGNL